MSVASVAYLVMVIGIANTEYLVTNISISINGW